MPYRYRLWCPDCCGEDPLGCFGGQVETDVEEFPTPVAANKAGWVATLSVIWEYEVIDEEGHVVEVEEAPWL